VKGLSRSPQGKERNNRGDPEKGDFDRQVDDGCPKRETKLRVERFEVPNGGEIIEKGNNQIAAERQKKRRARAILKRDAGYWGRGVLKGTSLK